MKIKLMKRIRDTFMFILVSFFMFTPFSEVNPKALSSVTIEIRTVQDLANINSNLSGSYKLMNDLDLTKATQASDGEFYHDGKGWVPLGTLENPFTGSFNGNGYTIKGLKSNRPNQPYVGLFGFTRSSTIHSINLLDVEITGNTMVGGFAGYTDNTTIELISVIGSVSGLQYVGGVVGYARDSMVNRVLSAADVVGDVSGIGGVIGRMTTYSQLSNAHSMAHVTSRKCGDDSYVFCAVGGVVGQMDDTSWTLIRAFFNGELTNKSQYGLNESTLDYYVKPLVGRYNDVLLSDLYYHLDYPSMDGVQLNRYEASDPASYQYFSFPMVWIMDEMARINLVAYPVEPPTLGYLRIATLPNQLEYKYNEDIDLSGLQLEAVYSDGSTKTLDETDYHVLIDRANQTVRLYYENVSTAFLITIHPRQEFQLFTYHRGYGGYLEFLVEENLISTYDPILEDTEITINPVLKPMGRLEYVLVDNLPLQKESLIIEQDTTIASSFYLLGDVQLDGRLNSKDTNQYVDLIFNDDIDHYSDTNEDGILDISDYVFLRNYILSQTIQKTNRLLVSPEGLPKVEVESFVHEENQTTVNLSIDAINQGAMYVEVGPDFNYDSLTALCEANCTVTMNLTNQALLVSPSEGDRFNQPIELTLVLDTTQANQEFLTLLNIQFSNPEGTEVTTLEDQVLSIKEEPEVIVLPALESLSINSEEIALLEGVVDYVYSTTKPTVTIQAQAIHPEHRVEGLNTIDLNEGENTLMITVFDQEERSTVYNLVVTYEKEGTDQGETTEPEEETDQGETTEPEEETLPETADTKNTPLIAIMLSLGLFLVYIGNLNKRVE